MDILEEVVVQKTRQFSEAEMEPHEWNKRGLADWVNLNFPLGIPEDTIVRVALDGQKKDEEPAPGGLFEGLSSAQCAVVEFLIKSIRDAYELKSSFENPDALLAIERYTILSAIDKLWQEHLYNMDSLRNSIGLRAYGQRDPLIEYKVEAKLMFDDMMVNVKSEICNNIFRSASSLGAFQNFLRNMPQRTVHVASAALGGATATASSGAEAASASKASAVVSEAVEAVAKARPVRTGPKVGRNEPCPCGSGKKFKNCCGRAG
jgi:preprotein translocase subunit SecA